MKINSIYISAFGKLKDYTLDLSDGFNVIYGENENGKSTVMAFIKMMFYGNGGRSSDTLKNPRKKYLPWDSSFMAGSITFTHNNFDYELQREFKGSNSTDKITLKNLTLGKSEALSGKNDIGSELFGLSLAAFEKSVFIGTLGAPEKNPSAEGELHSKLSNIVSTGDEDVSYETVSSRLIKARESLMSKSGKIGALDKAVSELEALNAKTRDAEENERKIKELEQIIADKESAAAKVKAEADRCFEIMKKAELFKKRQNLLKYIDAENELSAASKAIALKNGGIATKEYATEIRERAQNLSSFEKTLAENNVHLEQLNLELEALSKSCSEETVSKLKEQRSDAENKLFLLEQKADSIRERLHSTVAVSNKTKSGSSLPLILIGLLLGIGGGALLAFKFIYTSLYFAISLVLALVGIIILILGLIKKGKASYGSLEDEKTTTQNELDSVLTEIASSKDALDRISSDLNSMLIEQGGQKALLEAKQSDILKAHEVMLSLKDAILTEKEKLAALRGEFVSALSLESAITVAEFIEAKLSDIAAANIKKSLAADLTNCASKEEAESRIEELNRDKTLSSISAEEAESAKDTIRAHTLQSGKLREEIASLKSSLKVLLSTNESLPVLTLQKEELQRKIESQKSFCDKVDKALEVLELASATLRQNYGGALESLTAEIFKGLTNGEYLAVEVSKDLEVSVTKEGVFGAKQWQFLSAGTADQAYLSLRLALAELLNDDSPLPVIMDDSLAQYDDKRTLKAVEFLSSFAKEHQIILFTCHNSLKEVAKNFDSVITEL